jgi:hypothetical protein
VPTLERLLIDYEPDMLGIIADMWDVDLPGDGGTEDVETLVAVMSDPDAALATWARLSPEEHEALLTLQANDGRLSFSRFARSYGELRPMGPARRERERPWLSPANITEALYYRGLIARVFLREATGSQEYITIPGILTDLLPKPDIEEVRPGYPAIAPRTVPRGQCTAPDDLATIIAAVYIRELDARQWLLPTPIPRIDRHMRRREPTYRALLTQLAFDMQLINNAQGPTTQVDRDAVRPWLEASRDHQTRHLLNAWLRSTAWNMLAHTPGLTLDTDEWPNDPRLARIALLDALQQVPADEWWSVDSLIAFLHETQPDFQRPNGDYTLWYLRDTHTDELLQGYEHWYEVEGAHLRAIIEGPLFWLGAAVVHGGAFRLTGHGLALLERDEWPSRPDPQPQVTVTPQGVLHVPAGLSRYARLQVARFGSWDDTPRAGELTPNVAKGDDGVYTYRITAQTMQRVLDDEITIEQIIGYLQRLTRDSLPEQVAGMLNAWSERPQEVTIHNSVIVTIKDPVTLERLRRIEEVKRILGREVGPRAFAVRREQLTQLIEVLRAADVLPHFKGHPPDDYP